MGLLVVTRFIVAMVKPDRTAEPVSIVLACFRAIGPVPAEQCGTDGLLDLGHADDPSSCRSWLADHYQRFRMISEFCVDIPFHFDLTGIPLFHEQGVQYGQEESAQQRRHHQAAHNRPGQRRRGFAAAYRCRWPWAAGRRTRPGTSS